MPPRRVTTLLFAVGLCLLTIWVVTHASSASSATAAPESIPETTQAFLKGKLPSFEIPDFHFSFQKSAHKPPEQKNSTAGGSSWYSDWKWLNPFSSSVTLDEDRTVLPPLLERPPVYTYYEAKSKKDEETVEVDKELLQTWRRAWWAKGFRPIVISEADAMRNPLYQQLQGKGVSVAFEFEISRWLAWGHMGTGLLASWHCVPMGAYDDMLLARLRRGQYEQLTRFEGLEAGLFAGGKVQINEAIKGVLSDLKLNTFKAMEDAIDPDKFSVEQHTSIAYYNSATIKKRYPSLAEKLVKDADSGRRALNDLVVSHLHGTWQNTFSSGIAVLQPLPAHTSTLIEPSFRLAKLLAECPESFLQSSCPPNRPKCAPCVGKKMRITTPAAFRNTSTLFTIITVPHPYTTITLNNQTDNVNVAHIRRYTERDQWLTAVTRDLLGDGRGGPSRIMALKDAVASEAGKSRSIWFTVEDTPSSISPEAEKPKSPTNEAHPQEEMILPFPEDWLELWDWHFGFPVPRRKIPHGESFPPVPGPERWSNSIPGLPADRKKSWEPGPPTAIEQAIEVELLQNARKVLGRSNSGTSVFPAGSSGHKEANPGKASITQIAEAWNIADTEVWRFVRALGARHVLEREEWQQEEASFGTGASKGKSRWW